jgi:uncharacterized NAD(P)/FAD-binding protein YdhS
MAQKVATAVEELVATARERLRLAAEKQTFNRDKPVSKKALIQTLRPDIAALRAKGATWDDVARELADTVGAKGDTIRQVMLESAKRKKSKKARAEASAVTKTPMKQTASRDIPGEKPTGHGNLNREY